MDAKNVKSPSYLTGGVKSHVTVLACRNATGMVLPPFVILDCQTLNPQMTIGEVPGTLYGAKNTISLDYGWIMADLAYLDVEDHHGFQWVDHGCQQVGHHEFMIINRHVFFCI